MTNQMRNFDSPENVTAQVARDAWYPGMDVEDIKLYEVLFTTSADWHSEAHRVLLWLPIDQPLRAAILDDEFKAPNSKVIEVTTYEETL